MVPPLLPLALAFAAGIIADYAGVGALLWFAPLAIAGVLIIRKRTYPAILMLAFTLGGVNAVLRHPKAIDPALFGHKMLMSGVITRVSQGESSQSAIISIDSLNSSAVRAFKIRLVSVASEPELSTETRINFIGEIRPLESAVDFPDDIDPTPFYLRHGVRGATVVRDEDLLSLKPEKGWISAMRRWRYWLQDKLFKSELSTGAKGFLSATLTGDRQAIPESTTQLFSQTGLAHLLAISGLHVGLIAWIVAMMLYPLRFAMMWRTRTLLTMAILWLFIIMVGAGPAVVRAGIMATMFLAARFLERETDSLNALALAGMVILLYNPSNLFDPGFQLSFLAVASIILIVPRLVFVSHTRHNLHKILTFIAVPIAAMVATGVFAAFYFHIFPCYFLLVNIMAALMMPFIVFGGVIVTIATSLSLPCSFICWLTDLGYDCVTGLAAWISALPGATLQNIYLSPTASSLLIGSIILACCALYRRRLSLLVASALMIVITATSQFFYDTRFERYEAYILYDSGATGFLARSRECVCFFSTDPLINRSHDCTAINRRVHDYLGLRKLNNISWLADNTRFPGLSRQGNVISHDGKRYVFLSDDSIMKSYKPKIHYLVVCNGFKGDILDACGVIKPDSVLLSRDLNERRHNRYFKELRRASFPVKSLRHGYLVSKAPSLNNWR